MNPLNYKSGYTQNLEIGIIVSLSILIVLFYFSPDLMKETKKVQQSNYPQLIIIDIPPTRQNKPTLPKPVKPVIPVATDEIDFLTDVTLSTDSSIQISFDDIGMLPRNATDFTVQPRQILEVLPENMAADVKGEIVLSLLIGWDGKVKQQKLLSNTTNCEDCLNSVLAAVTKSRWQPVKIQGDKIEYWIRKAYIFN